MSNVLKIRAAKVLGWKLKDGFFLPPKRIFNRSIFSLELLEFDSSYDWAMLGVKVLLKKGYSVRLDDEGILIMDEDFITIYNLHGFDIGFPEPEQITLGWVEVLEAA